MKYVFAVFLELGATIHRASVFLSQSRFDSRQRAGIVCPNVHRVPQRSHVHCNIDGAIGAHFSLFLLLLLLFFFKQTYFFSKLSN
jgi:hypothetical protein